LCGKNALALHALSAGVPTTTLRVTRARAAAKSPALFQIKEQFLLSCPHAFGFGLFGVTTEAGTSAFSAVAS
jgi:hypothetical protein